ncbi:MAG: SpoIIE family protein phosphatase [Rhodospirillaceae bacterium]|jgi:phosphoserine phosphatase RsbU/P|nr:SpoIIE family protein phosphatase [Rhodospirillaceae bacterium]MBT5245326.1 SpoIIE family protein phosphatase [Rhodospirillaceae bacterium]MBT5561201.1 SpoIIE family protein phosphatase [Rhodospirillaceae bacterium]MBT6242737.1 SpoIIE family protein phosphatase [Rhodospirillaceae bacterium]MBT7137283.1 SpoIIE family protein phosphatase [Rhodospirillaceae bacterium]
MPRTLVIDDDPQLQVLIGAGVSDEYCFAHSDDEALEVLSRDQDIDIAVVAIDGDNIGGMGLFRRLKGERLRIPRIALTTGSDLGVIRRAMNEGAVDFLTKPVSMDDLQATIDKVYMDCEARRKAWRTESELAAIRREIDVAGDLQQRILPSDFPTRDDFDVFARTTPAQDIGGDFYDFFELGQDKLALIVADVSGKGVPAAFFMAVARTLIRATAATQPEPGACLQQVNKLLYQHNIPGMFVSVFYGILDTKNWTMSYANGGHLPPYLIPGDGGDIVPLSGGDGVVLGVQDEIPYEQETISIDPGAAIFFYTDGVTEAFDINRNQFSDQRLIDYLLENRSLSAHAISDNVFAFINMFTGDAPQSDDITSLVIKRF